MPDKKVAEPDRDGPRQAPSDPTPRDDEAFRLACRRYSHLRARNPG